MTRSISSGGAIEGPLMQKKRRHHYVWQYYLSSWQVGGKVCCLRDGKIFRSATANIAQQRDFYRLRELGAKDWAFVGMFVDASTEKELIRLNRGWVDRLQLLFQLRRLAERRGRLSSELEEHFDVMFNNIEEDLHQQVEHSGIEFIDRLRQRDLSFFEVSEDKASFLFYLVTQYFRTKKMQVETENRIRRQGSASSLKGVNITACWKVLRHVLATNVGASLMADRGRFQPELLSAPDHANFITGDQPVINLRGTSSQDGEPPQSLDLYYPVSPNVAFLIRDGSLTAKATQPHVSIEDVGRYNAAMAAAAHEQLYAVAPSDLASLSF